MFKQPVSRRLAAFVAAVDLVVLLCPHAEARGLFGRGFGGAGYSRSVTRYNNGGGNFGHTTTFTGPGGKTATSTVNRSVSNGTITTNRTVTGPNGQTFTSTATHGSPGSWGPPAPTGPCCYGGNVAAGVIAGAAVGTAAGVAATSAAANAPPPPPAYPPPPVVYAPAPY